MDHEPGSIRTSESGDQKTKVLLIDDNHTFLKQMQRFFAPKILGIPDVELTVCDDPISGITRLEEQRFDLLLVDFHMPHVDGLKLLEWLASHEHPNQGMVKIMLTADPSIPERKRAAIVAAGARIVSKGMPIEDMKILVAGVKQQTARNQAQLRAAVELTAI
jgi:CheY-like chemotaxis protein